MLKQWWNFLQAKRALHRFYAAPDKSNVAKILVLLTNLTPEYKEQLLSVKNVNGYTLLQFAVRNYPVALDPLLNILTQLNQNVQARILSAKIPPLKVYIDSSNRSYSFESPMMQEEIRKHQPSDTTAGDWNVLEIAVRYQPQLVAPLLNVINNLDSNSHVAMFTRSNDYLGALQLAATHYPEVLKLLLEAIAKLNPRYHNQVVSDISKEESRFLYFGYRDGEFNFFPVNVNNIVAMAVRWKKEDVSAWLKIIATLEHKAQATMLTGIIQVYQKALPAAAEKNPNAMIQLLDTIAILDRQAQIKIFTYNKTLLNKNCLQSAAPKAVKPLLEAIDTLDTAAKVTIFCHTTYGLNALQMHIEERHIDEVKQILSAIAKLDPKYQASILCNKTESYCHASGFNALQMAAYYAPELIKPLLKAIATLDPAIALVIFANKNKDGENVTDIASQKCPEYIVQIKEAETKALQKQTQKLKVTHDSTSNRTAPTHKSPRKPAFFPEAATDPLITSEPAQVRGNCNKVGVF